MALNTLFLNCCFDKNKLKSLIAWSLLAAGEMKTIQIVENLKELGFRFATKAGISLSLDDLKIPPEKVSVVSQATQEAGGTHQEYQRGNLTAIERSQHLIDTWHRTSETLKQGVVNSFQLTDKLSPVYMMAFSGARGNISQVRQLSGMRGLMADPQGQIIGFPIRSNFREGLTLTEYMISCYGARKGLVDTALRTADAGYLTRRLVDVSQHMIVKTATCATSKGIVLQDLQASGKMILPLRDRLIGRVLAQDLPADKSPIGEGKGVATPSGSADIAPPGVIRSGRARPYPAGPGETKQLHAGLMRRFPAAWRAVSVDSFKGVLPEESGRGMRLLASRNQEISVELASQIASRNSSVSVRSPLTCSVRHGVCQLCYGWSLSEGRLVTLGEAVGIVAAQSIGEPGTQLTMRTFHTGGVFSGDVMAEIRAPFDGIARFPTPLQGLLIRTSHGKVAFLTKTKGTLALAKASAHKALNRGAAEHRWLVGRNHTANQGSEGAQLTAERQGQLPKGRGQRIEGVDGSSRSQAPPGQGSKDFLRPAQGSDAHFSLDPATVLFVRQGEKVKQGQLLAEFSSIGPEVNETIEAKRTLFANIAGQVSFAKMAMGTRLKENGEILQLSKDLGFLWVLSGRRAPITPLLAIYNKGCHLISKNSLLSRHSLQLSKKPLQATSRGPKAGRQAARMAAEPAACRKSQRLPLQPFGKEQPAPLLTTPAIRHFSHSSKAESSPASHNNPAVGHQGHRFKGLPWPSSSCQARPIKERPLSPLPRASREILFQGASLAWLPEKYNSCRGGFAWIDSRYVSQPFTFGEMLWVEEDSFVCPLSSNDKRLPSNTANQRRSSSFLRENLEISPSLRKNLEIPPRREELARPYQIGGNVGAIGSKTATLPVSLGIQGVNGGDTPSNADAVFSPPHAVALGSQREGGGKPDSFPFLRNWVDQGATLLRKRNLQGRGCMELRCTAGLVKKAPLESSNWPGSSTSFSFPVIQPALSSRGGRGSSLPVDGEGHLLPPIDPKTSGRDSVGAPRERGGSHRAGNLEGRSPATRSPAARQSSNFKKVASLHSTFLQHERGLGSRLASDLSRSVLISPAGGYGVAIRNGCYDEPAPRPVGNQGRFNPLSTRLNGSRLRTAKGQAFVQSWFPRSLMETEPPPRLQSKSLGGWALSGKGSDCKTVSADDIRVGFATRWATTRWATTRWATTRWGAALPPSGRPPRGSVGNASLADDNFQATRPPTSVPFLQHPRLKILLEQLGKRLASCDVAPVFAKLDETNRELLLASLGLKTGWMYYPKDTARLAACHEGTHHVDGGSLDSLFFDSAFVYFDALNTPSFSYRLADIPLCFSIKLTAFQKKDAASIAPAYQRKTFPPHQVFSILEHMLARKVWRINGGSRPPRSQEGKLERLVKPGFFKSEGLLSLLAWKPLSSLGEAGITSRLKGGPSDRQPHDKVGRDVLLFLRKTLWLAQRSVGKFNGNLKTGGRFPGEKEEQIKEAKIRRFQLLFWRDTANQSQFLWLRGFPLQFQIITNQKPRHRLHLSPHLLSDRSLPATNGICGAKDRPAAAPLSRRRAVEFQGGEAAPHCVNSLVSSDPLSMQRVGRTRRHHNCDLPAVIRSGNALPSLSLRTGKEWWQSCYSGDDYPVESGVSSPLLFAIIRKAHPYPIGSITKGKSGLLQTTHSKSRRAGKPKATDTRISTATGSFAGDALATAAPQGSGLRARLLARGIDSSSRIDSSSSREACFEFCTKQFSTKLLSKAPAIGLLTMPLLSFNRFQTTSLSKPLQLVRFGVDLAPSPCFKDVVFKDVVAKKPACGLLVTSPQVLVMSPQEGEMVAQSNLYAQNQHPSLGHGSVSGAWWGADDETAPRTLAAPSLALLRAGGPRAALLAKKPLTNAALLAENDCASLSTTHQRRGFATELVPVIQRSVGQFVTLGQEIAPGQSSVLSGQVVSIEREKTTLRRTQPLLFYAQGAMHVNHGEWVDKNAPILTLTYQKLVTGDIVAGIPKIEQFFEAPATKEGEPMPSSLQAKLRRTFQRLKVTLPLAQAAKESLAEIQQILVEGVLKVYLSQGVRIADKHLEIVIRQMTSKGHILDVGNTGLFQGEHVNLHRLEHINLATYGEKADYEPAVLGITQASLDSESFISAASFQETTRVLSRDTIVGKTDFLRGLKERVVLGDLVQAGTGLDDNINYGLLLGVSMPPLSS